jgi:hypothetical protein
MEQCQQCGLKKKCILKAKFAIFKEDLTNEL